VPEPTINPYYIEDCLNEETSLTVKPTAKIVWLGTTPMVAKITKKKRALCALRFHESDNQYEITLEEQEANWLLETLPQLSPKNDKLLSFAQLKTSFEKELEHFELFWFSKPMEVLKERSLLVL